MTRSYTADAIAFVAILYYTDLVNSDDIFDDADPGDDVVEGDADWDDFGMRTYADPHEAATRGTAFDSDALGDDELNRLEDEFEAAADDERSDYGELDELDDDGPV